MIELKNIILFMDSYKLLGQRNLIYSFILRKGRLLYMSLLILVIIAFIAFAISLKIYGDYLGKLVGLDDSKKTPAHTMTIHK